MKIFIAQHIYLKSKNLLFKTLMEIKMKNNLNNLIDYSERPQQRVYSPRIPEKKANMNGTLDFNLSF